MLNIVSEMLAKRARELGAEEQMTTVIILKQPGKNVKQGAPKGQLVLSIRSMSEIKGFAVRMQVKMPGMDARTENFTSLESTLAPRLQKALTPLKILAFADGVPWTVGPQQG